MSDSNRVALRYVEEVTPGVTPANPKFQALRITGAPSLAFTPKTLESEEIRDDRQASDLMFVGGEAGGEVPYELSHESLDDMLQAALFGTWQTRAYRRNDKGATEITAIVTGGSQAFTVADTAADDFADGDILRAEGFGTANDGFHYVTTGTTATSVRISADTTLVAQGSIPGTARLRKVGVRGLAGDIDATAAVGGVATLTSTTLNFTTLGLEKGDRIKLRGFPAGSAANNDWVRVRDIAANVLTIDLLPVGWASATLTIEWIEIYLGERVKNGVLKRSFTLEEEFTDHSPVTFSYTRGMTPSEISLFEGGSQEVLTGQVTFLGFDQEYTDANTPDKSATPKRPALDVVTGRIISATTLAAPSTTPFNTAGNVKRVSVGGVVLAKNLVFEASIEIDNGLRARNAWGVEGAVSIGVGEFAVSGSLATYFDDRSLVESVVKNTETALDFRFEDGDKHALLADMPRVKLQEGAPEVPGKNTDSVANLGYKALVHRDFGYTLKLQRFHGVQ
jgi:hypothetical protein